MLLLISLGGATWLCDPPYFWVWSIAGLAPELFVYCVMFAYLFDWPSSLAIAPLSRLADTL
jgi:hypothetical protein